MFGLRQQVGCDKRRICCTISHYEHFRWPGWHVDGNSFLAYKLLRTCNELISRTEYLVHLRNGRCAVRHGCNGLCTAYSEYLCNAGKSSSIKNGRVDIPLLVGRRTQYHLSTACQTRRNPQHEYGREQRRRSTGNVNSNLIDRYSLTPARYTGHRLDGLAFLDLTRVKSFYVFGSGAHGGLKPVVERLYSALDFFRCEGQRAEAYTVKLQRKVC